MQIDQQNNLYRRGMVLGLTMAEVMLLILFTLLIALGALLAEKKKEITEVTEERNHMKKENELLMERAPELREVEEAARIAGFSTITEFWMHIQEVQGVQAEVKRLQEYNAHLEESEMQAKAEVERLSQQVETLEAFEEVYLQVAEEISNPDELAQFVENTAAEKEDLQQTLKLCEKKLDYAQEKCGSGPPPCWPKEKGKGSEILYHVALTKGGMIIKPPRVFPDLPGLREAPLKNLQFNQELTSEEFKQKTLPIYEWAKNEGCFFLADVYDLTKEGTGMKKIFKQRLTDVRERFYEKPSWKNPKRNAQWPEM